MLYLNIEKSKPLLDRISSSMGEPQSVEMVSLMWSGGVESTILLDALMYLGYNIEVISSSRHSNQGQSILELNSRNVILRKITSHYKKTPTIREHIYNVENINHHEGLIRPIFIEHLNSITNRNGKSQYVIVGMSQSDTRTLPSGRDDLDVFKDLFELSLELYDFKGCERTKLIVPLEDMSTTEYMSMVDDISLFIDTSSCECPTGLKTNSNGVTLNRCGECYKCLELEDKVSKAVNIKLFHTD